MSFLQKISHILLLLPLLAAPACSSDAPDAPDGPSESEVAGYLKLTVSAAGDRASRATADSEDGDGREPGNDNESAIYDLTIFAYTDQGEGLDGNYNIVWEKYITTADTDIEDSNPSTPLNRIYLLKIPLKAEDFQKLKLSGNIMRCAVVANAGDLTGKFFSLSDLMFSTSSYGSAWTQEDGLSSAKHFVMSSAFNGAKRSDSYRTEGRIFSHQSNDEGLVYYGAVTLERVAARIDLQFSTNENEVKQNDDKTLTYAVKDVDHTVTLLNVIPVNVMRQNSYLFKHLSGRNVESHDNEHGHFIAADETRTGNLPDNYVYCPSFFGGMAVPDNTTLNNWFGNTRAAVIKESPYLYTNSGKMDSYGASFVADGKNTITLTYANENTHHESIQMTGTDNGTTTHASDYLTGLLFRAQYHPAVLYTNGDCTETTPYIDGNTFWLFRTIGTDVKESNNRYFASRAALNAYVATLPAGGKYETVQYTNGICYYNIWIKHNSLDDTDENFPMKYGIVRNNIYRINLNFHGIGQPKPEIAEPYAVVSRIYVIKWNFRPQPEIVM